MDNLEENIKIRAITGGCNHKSSFVFHIECDGNYYQYVKNHLNTRTINLGLVKTSQGIFVFNEFLVVYGIETRVVCRPSHLVLRMLSVNS